MALKNILLRTLHQRNKFMNIAAIAERFTHREQSYSDRQRQQQHKHYRKLIGTVLFSAAVLAKSKQDGKKGSDNFNAGDKIPGLPVYRADEVEKHNTKESFWVIYKNGVYDITKFLPSHPGGEQILNAGGLSIEPFWNVYGMHKTKQNFELLESFRIGNLHDDDVVDHSDIEMWVREPHRDSRLDIKTPHPFNAEVPADLQIKTFHTPNEIFFVRNHMAVPELKSENHKIKINISDKNTEVHKEFDLKTLCDMFPSEEVWVTLMCAGNRRTEMNKVRAVKGIDWRVGAISNALWCGVPLRDVLLHCGLDPHDTAGKHVIFTGSDMDATGTYFSTSIPLDQALNPNGKILLATHMNGEVLPKDHGYPLRVIVPGAPAVRSVKWLQAITVSYEESPSHWHQGDYRSFNASDTWESADFPSAPPIYSLPVTSAICDPCDGDTVTAKDGYVAIRGYAFSGGGAKIVRVDLSPDRGRSWVRATDTIADDAPPSQHYAWTQFVAWLPVPPGQTEMEIWAKATDSNFNTQPEKFDDIWNIRGLLSNAYHRIRIKIKQ